MVPFLSALSSYKLSPLRLVAPRAISTLEGFSIRAGVTDYAPPICKLFNNKNYEL